MNNADIPRPQGGNMKELYKLAAIYNQQVKRAFNTWITMAIFCVYSIGAISLTDLCGNGIKLPFVDITISRHWYLLISLGFIAALLAHWVEILNRTVNTRFNIVQPKIEELEIEELKSWNKGKHSIIEMWDAQIIPGSATVWSAPFSLLFYKKKIIKILAFPYLFILKLASAIVHFGLPAVALIQIVIALFMEENSPFFYLLIIFFTLIAALQLLEAISVELRYTIRAFKTLKKHYHNGSTGSPIRPAPSEPPH